MKVSVALATFNGERFLGEQLASLANQTRLPDELIVCDDASSDTTLKILASFEKRSPFPVRIHRNESNIGFAANFLQAAALCHGDVIAFCDQDDVWLRHKLARCSAVLMETGASLVIHSSDVVDAELRPLSEAFPRFKITRVAPPLGVDPWFVPPGFCMVFARCVLEMANCEQRPMTHLGEVQMPHDQWVYFLASGSGITVFLRDRLALYRQHNLNLAGVPATGILARIRACLEPNLYKQDAKLAFDYALFWEEASQRADSSLYRERFRAASSHYSRLGERFALRARFYLDEVKGRERARCFTGLALRGGYNAKRRGGLGLSALAKDVAYAVVCSGR